MHSWVKRAARRAVGGNSPVRDRDDAAGCAPSVGCWARAPRGAEMDVEHPHSHLGGPLLLVMTRREPDETLVKNHYLEFDQTPLLDQSYFTEGAVPIEARRCSMTSPAFSLLKSQEAVHSCCASANQVVARYRQRTRGN